MHFPQYQTYQCYVCVCVCAAQAGSRVTLGSCHPTVATRRRSPGRSPRRRTSRATKRRRHRYVSQPRRVHCAHIQLGLRSRCQALRALSSPARLLQRTLVGVGEEDAICVVWRWRSGLETLSGASADTCRVPGRMQSSGAQHRRQLHRHDVHNRVSHRTRLVWFHGGVSGVGCGVHGYL